ncbi:Crp/Fnr family transcriptional regulator [Fusibacter sp. 3D3]|uniref:Crp/Fnr family transcriptional regulator n=1 Tax=Fusibacter sp. 3D3 TaxID=1048380 RepID=UPI0008537D83|nr:cyclic nucleotide-binding domain-containing protein [Fusibacter sp. 3D3]GAU78065.1 predicted N-ribosylNicotinamide CRP-like regulator [Fusibacter sp. 3D3]
MKLIKHPQKLKSFLEVLEVKTMLDESILKALELCEYEKDEIVLEADDPLDYYYFFLEGKLKVFQQQKNGRNLLIQFYTKFDTLGDVELIESLNVTCTVSAVEKSYLFRIDAAQMKRFVENNVPYLKYIIRGLSIKMRYANENDAYNLLNPVKNRLASYLLWHHEEDSNEVILAETLVEISEFIGTTYRQLHRAFIQLEADAIIKRTGKVVRIHDPKAIKALAGQIYHKL